jgi:hypothetical protein
VFVFTDGTPTRVSSKGTTIGLLAATLAAGQGTWVRRTNAQQIGAYLWGAALGALTVLAELRVSTAQGGVHAARTVVRRGKVSACFPLPPSSTGRMLTVVMGCTSPAQRHPIPSATVNSSRGTPVRAASTSRRASAVASQDTRSSKVTPSHNGLHTSSRTVSTE